MTTINRVSSITVSSLDTVIEGLDPQLMLAFLRQSIDSINEDIKARAQEIKRRNMLRKRLIQLKEDLIRLKDLLPKEEDNIQKIDWKGRREISPNELPEELQNFLIREGYLIRKRDGTVVFSDKLGKYDKNGNGRMQLRDMIGIYLANKYSDLFGGSKVYVEYRFATNTYRKLLEKQYPELELLSKVLDSNCADSITSQIDSRIQELTTNDELEMLELQSLVKKYDSILQTTSNIINKIYNTQSAIIRNIGG